ncbi:MULTISPECIES: YjgN family protein [Acinetobacter]|uniref:DUF898 family protein n=1 Tax=Acinetobacter pecorum TaxID=2762215 RepID=A0ABR8VYL2_9GAMM|nr:MULTISPECIES: DUF898 family protein [Acinetobacter]MBD8009857.1 DUF898 family protein [Acinetobacter pecorum]OAL82478.1 hypothetical protein AY605_12760 [Acinetobacter sp. SFD]
MQQTAGGIRVSEPLFPAASSFSTEATPSVRPKYQRYEFKFHGSTSEYFGIWLSNILLTVLTLTLYSPWAKSRRQRYFYGNTEFLQRRFDFTGLPSKIFLGRLLALEIYIVFLVVSNYSVLLTTLGLGMLYMAVPWLFRLTLKFRSRNTKFGNTRFYFYGENKYLYRLLSVEVIKTLLSLFILLPRLIWLYKHYCFDHLQLGQFKFRLNATHKNYMSAVYRPLLLMLAFSFAMVALIDASQSSNSEYDLLIVILLLLWVIGLIFILPIMLARIYITTWNNLFLGENFFKTRANPWRYAWIVLSNWVLKIISLGLLSAWADIRFYQYKTSMLELFVLDDPNKLQNMLQPDPNSLAAEFSSMFDFDASL